MVRQVIEPHFQHSGTVRKGIYRINTFFTLERIPDLNTRIFSPYILHNTILEISTGSGTKYTHALSTREILGCIVLIFMSFLCFVLLILRWRIKRVIFGRRYA